MMNYTDIIRDLLDQQYPYPQETKTMVITTIQLRILPKPAKPLFVRYQFLENLVLTRCDLRNLENFPQLTSLKTLDLSHNSLQGTLNNLMPLVNLDYLCLAHNLISDFRKLQPLQMIDNLEVFLVGNPFLDVDIWKNKVKSYGIKVLKEGRQLEIPAPKIKQEEKKKEKQVQKKPEPQKDPIALVSQDSILHRRSSFLYQIRARRKRQEDQQRIRRNLLEADSESNSLIQIIRPSEENPPPEENQNISSQFDRDDDSDQQEEEDENQPQEYESLNGQIEPFMDVFLHEDLPNDEDENNSDESLEN